MIHSPESIIMAIDSRSAQSAAPCVPTGTAPTFTPSASPKSSTRTSSVLASLSHESTSTRR